MTTSVLRVLSTSLVSLMVLSSAPRRGAAVPTPTPTPPDYIGIDYAPAGGPYDPVDSTCAEAATDIQCSSAADAAGSVTGDRVNILVIVSDDQGYCQYGFMHGRCRNAPQQLCRSNIDCCLDADCCDADHPCSEEDQPVCEAGSPGDPVLRLSDLSCRYRQPPSPLKKYPACEGVDSEVKNLASDDPKGAFPFDPKNVPCPHTINEFHVEQGFLAGGRDPGGRDAADFVVKNPVPLTPNLDQLATEGALFTRAHVAGSACKPSRAIMMYGKHHRHLKELDEVKFTAEVHEHPPTLAYWVDHAAPGQFASYRYEKILWGKGEVVTENQGGFDRGETSSGPKTGRYKCKDTTPPTCQQDVLGARLDSAVVDKIPKEAVEGKGSVEDMFDALFEGGEIVEESPATVPEATRRSVWKKPFFLWFAPKMPHKGGAGQSYKSMYQGLGKKTQDQFGRVTQLDEVVGAIVDRLKRTCVCRKRSAGPRLESLYDNTVVIFLSDHGTFLPGAKGNHKENTHRTIMIINDPRHRPGADAADGWNEQLAHFHTDDDMPDSIDLLDTVHAYAAGLQSPAPLFPDDPVAAEQEGTSPAVTSMSAGGYPLSRNLKAVVESVRTASDTPSPIRCVQFGEESKQAKGNFGADDRGCRNLYMIPRRGRVGLCRDGNIPPNPLLEDGHIRVCVEDGDCCVDGEDCESPTYPWKCAKAKRCVNRPDKLCTGEAECRAGLCDPVTLHCKLGVDFSLGDFAPRTGGEIPAGGYQSKPCTVATEGSDCAPEGASLCRAPLLKVEAGASGACTNATDVAVVSVWDLDTDPDQRNDLGKDFLKPGALEKFTSCLGGFFALNADKTWAHGADPPSAWCADFEDEACRPPTPTATPTPAP